MVLYSRIGLLTRTKSAAARKKFVAVAFLSKKPVDVRMTRFNSALTYLLLQRILSAH